MGQLVKTANRYCQSFPERIGEEYANASRSGQALPQPAWQRSDYIVLVIFGLLLAALTGLTTVARLSIYRNRHRQRNR